MKSQEILDILTLSPNPTAVYSGQAFVIEAANDAMLSLWGKDRSVIGKPIAEAFPEMYKQSFSGILQKVMTTGVSYRATDTEARVMRNGKPEISYFDFVYEAVTTEGDETCILCTASDVTRYHLSKEQEVSTAKALLQEANLALAASQQQSEIQRNTLYDFFMKAPTGICILVSEELIFEMVNPRYQQLLPDKILIGRPIFKVLPELIGQPVADILREVYKTGIEADVNEMLIPVRSAAGILEDRYFTCNVQPRKNLHGEVDGIFNFVYEVTDQVTARRAIEERELHFKHLADLVPAKISNALPTGEVTFFNRLWLDFSGLSFEDTRDFGYHQMMHPDEIAGFQAGLYEAAMQGKPYISEMRFKNIDGKYIWHLNIASPILDENGNITMWVGSTTDIQSLKEEEQRKSDFVSMLSHELKTPITTIKGYIQLLVSLIANESVIGYPPLLNTSLNRVDKLVTRLTSLIDEMLNLGKIESGKLTFKKEKVSLNELVKIVVDDFRLTNKHHDIRLEAHQEFMVNAEADKIGQVLINFISNAIKYAPQSMSIDVSIHPAGENDVAVSVQDYGMGIDTAEHKNVFNRFYRVEGKIEQQVTGFGIGLFIAKSVIEGHGGRITLESTKGKGSIFTFILPVA